ncbi:MAG: transglutaminase family protein [Alphaproteobacteria bacterium]|nr:transglutaminase family protein [Alphaproteobacteria bacterium]
MIRRFCGLVLLGLILAPRPLQAAELPLPGDTELQALRALDLDGAFAAVATGIRFEAYPGILRGPRGAVLAHGGNAADQALLLADILRGRGYRVRFVRGQLDGGNLDTLIRGMYPPDFPNLKLAKDYLPYDPGADTALRALVADHVWLEVDQGDGTWLPLDPSFPRAKPGEAYATPMARPDDLPEDMHQRIRLTLHEETAGGETRELGRLEGRAAVLGLTPLSLAILGVPQLKAPEPEKKKGGGAGSLFGGAMSGGGQQLEPAAGPQEPAKTVGIMYRRMLQREDETVDLTPSLVLDEEAGSAIRREWLEIAIEAPGRDPHIVVRDLYVDDAPAVDGAAPAPYRRYSLAVMTGPVDDDAVRDYARRLGTQIDLDASKARIDAIGDSTDSKAASEVVAVDGEIGPLAGHLAGLAFAAESDALARRIGHNNGVAFAQATPRIVIVSVEGGSATSYRVALDLRLDEVEAWSYPGYATRAAEHFQSARGIQNTMLEGHFLERILGVRQTANTADLIAGVEGGQGAMLVFGLGQEGRLDRIEGLSPYARRLIEQSLGKGREVIIPPRPVQLAGRARLGWWEREPGTGRVVGVMDDGLHQAMTSYSVDTKEIGLNDETGFVIGAIVGATSTQFMIAGLMLEYGELTDQLIAKVEASLEGLKCLSCPKAEASASAGVSYGDSCFSVGVKIEAGVSVSAGSFCEQYVAGMTCASSMILQGLKGESGGPSVSVSAGVEAKAGC